MYQSANIPMLSPFPGAMSALQQVKHRILTKDACMHCLQAAQEVGFSLSHKVSTFCLTELAAALLLALLISATHH